MAATGTDRKTEARANELYWSSDRSVNQIADELDLSKGTLYGMIRPLQADISCPACTQEVVFPNRTAKERGLVVCPSCGWEGDHGGVEAGGADDPVTVALDVQDDVPAPPPSALSGSWTRTLAGGALLGAAAGLALVVWSRRR
jgi:hypothetical protein